MKEDRTIKIIEVSSGDLCGGLISLTQTKEWPIAVTIITEEGTRHSIDIDDIERIDIKVI